MLGRQNFRYLEYESLFEPDGEFDSYSGAFRKFWAPLQLLHRGILAKNRIPTLSKGPRGHDDELNRKLIQPDKSPPNTHPDH